jgi:cytochrome P450
VRRIREHRPVVEETVRTSLDAIEAAGPPSDLVEAFALPVAMNPQCALLGVPSSYGRLLLRSRALSEDPATAVDELVSAARDIRSGINEVIDHKRRQPANDVVSDLIANPAVTDDEIRSLVTFLFAAGVDATQEMLSLSVFALLTHTDQLAKLRSGAAPVDAAVEELLRYLTALQLGPDTRTAREDVELEGRTIAAGEMVFVSLTAANRDPEKFSDPDQLDLTRDAAGHLAFGQGVHMCLGQHLARLELQVGLRALFDRFPTLRLAVPPEEIPRHPDDAFLYGVDELPVEW